MHTVEYLKTFQNKVEALESLEKYLGIRNKVYEGHGLVVLNYNQIESPKTDPIVRECRGLILDMDNDWEVVCRPFERFFNYGEAPETLTDFSFERSEIFEKADGSLVKVYRHEGRWHVATRGTAFAETENNLGRSFYDMILESFGLTQEEFTSETDEKFYRDTTHLYELINKDNRIVTPYSKNEMVYLGSIDNETGEFSYENILIGKAREADSFRLESIDDCLEAAKSLKDLQEGYVVRDLATGQAVKIKSPLYVAAHHLRGELGLTPKKIATLVVTNETAEYLRYFPDDMDKISPYADAWGAIHAFATFDFVMANPLEEQKDFAMVVKDYPYASALFTARKKDITASEAINAMGEQYKVKLLLDYCKKVFG